MSDDEYTPSGFIEVGSAAAKQVLAVTVDGVTVTNCFRANDAEGWADRYTGGCMNGVTPDFERVAGTVRFVLRPEPPAEGG